MTNKEALATVLELAQVGENVKRTDGKGRPVAMDNVKENIDAIMQMDNFWEAMED